MFFKGPKGVVKGVKSVKEEARLPLNLIFMGDQSGSMLGETKVITETGETLFIPKIEQLTQGFRMVQKSLLRFQKENTRFYIKYQYVEVNTYSKALFPTYERIDDPNYNLAEVNFSAGGVTNVEAAFETVKQFINTKHLEHYNRPVNIIMFSDGIPTDINGYALSKEQMKKLVDDFKLYLVEKDYARSVEIYFIAIGDEAEYFGRLLAGDEHFFTVEDGENFADKLDFATRLSLANSTTSIADLSDIDDDDDSDYEDEDFDDEEDDLDEDGEDFDEDEGYDEEDEDDEDFDDDENIKDNTADKEEEYEDKTDSETEEDDDDGDDGSLSALFKDIIDI